MNCPSVPNLEETLGKAVALLGFLGDDIAHGLEDSDWPPASLKLVGTLAMVRELERDLTKTMGEWVNYVQTTK